ncbi:MAG: B12-binding domain-containing protein [Planctomycetes bacterium]|nr:B12-binding domain-containing protein [Planctomycetota bacterium]
MSRLVTPRQVAQAIGVSESSLKRWCDQGLLRTVRTAGGHRRLPVEQVVQFLRQSGHTMVRPELLGLPSNTGQGPTIAARAEAGLREALIAGDEPSCRRITLDLYLSGHSASGICDRIVTPALHSIGDLWQCGDVEVFQERRACEFCQRILHELRTLLPAAEETAPQALGGTPECDPYTIPTAMVEITLRQAGWRAQSLGSRLPLPTLLTAIDRHRPQIFWLSVSHIDDEEQFLREYRQFYLHAHQKTAIVVGGRALNDALRPQMEYAAFCDNLQHLESFADTLHRSQTKPR